MPFQGIADPEDLKMLSQILGEHCRDIGIKGDTVVSEALAVRIVYLFQHGVCGANELKTALRFDREL